MRDQDMNNGYVTITHWLGIKINMLLIRLQQCWTIKETGRKFPDDFKGPALFKNCSRIIFNEMKLLNAMIKYNVLTYFVGINLEYESSKATLEAFSLLQKSIKHWCYMVVCIIIKLKIKVYIYILSWNVLFQCIIN